MTLLAFHPGAILSVLAFGALIAWVAWSWGRNSADPPAVLALKVLVSVGLVGAAVFAMLRIHPIVGVPAAAVCGVVVGLLWGRNIGLAIISPLTNLYDGGNEADAPKPFYSIAEAHRKQGRYQEAIEVIEEQLDRFPGDARGLLMLAEIRCRNLGDWVGAEVAVEQVVGNEALAVSTRAKALQALADWRVEIAQDTGGAGETLKRIDELFPGTPEAMEAAQRLAHLGDGAWRREQHAPSRLVVIQGDPRLGLRSDPHAGPTAPPEPDAEVELARLQAQLRAHPLDTEAREKLAALYADRMGRLDWAVAEVEKLVMEPHHPPRSVARWLHLLADLHVRCGADEVAARAALERVGRMFPGSALEAAARSRLERLKVEIRGKTTGQVLRLGPKPEAEPE
jgi:hypothetical protein